GKRDDDDGLDRITRQAAGVRALLQCCPGTLHIAETEVNREYAERNQKRERAEYVDNGLCPGAQPAVDDVHAHVAVDTEHIGSAEHEDDIEGINLNFEI